MHDEITDPIATQIAEQQRTILTHVQRLSQQIGGLAEAASNTIAVGTDLLAAAEAERAALTARFAATVAALEARITALEARAG